MYENIGKKIKGLAKTIFIIMAILYGIIGIAVMASGDEVGVLTGLLTIVIGFFFSWIASWMLYGFGELIDKACDIERNTRRANQPTFIPYQHNQQDYNNQQSYNAGYAPYGAQPNNPFENQAPTPEMSERIARLQALRDKGLITEEEYQNAISK